MIPLKFNLLILLKHKKYYDLQLLDFMINIFLIKQIE